MLEKKEFVDQIMVNVQNHIHVRVTTQIVENNKVLSQTFFRKVLCPGDDYSNEDIKVQLLCKTVWA